MSRFLRLSLLATAILLMIACGLSTTAAPNSNAILANNVVALAVQAQPATFNAVGQPITFNYSVTNTSTSPLTGPVTVTDNKITGINCPDLKTIGNKDDKLDGGAAETLICTARYNTTQDDINTGAITSAAQAHIGGNDSNPVTTVVNIALNKVLTISVSANPTTYSQANQTITYTYVVTNVGAATLPAAQFFVNDDHATAPIPCGANNATLATNQSVTCTGTYVTTQNDTTVGQFTNSVTATGAGAGTTQPGSATVTNTNVVGSGSNPSTTYQRGSTVRHPVSSGEWLLQIARCYGADYSAVLGANPQIVDPDIIYVSSTVVVPNIGSFATPYGPPCIKPYTVKSGDTWQSIANDPANDAGVSILMAANEDTALSPGKVITIPIHSKPYEGIVTPAPTNPSPPTNQPIRITFSAQSPKVTLQGNIGTPQTIRYVFTGAAGQVLMIKVTVPSNDVGFAVYGPNNQTVKALDPNTSWSGTLVANGDHLIDLISSLGASSKAYTLEVTLTTPAAASPFQRVTNINPGSADSKPSYLSVFNGSLYFQATSNNNLGPEIWKYDAGLNAASRLADTVPNAAGKTPTFLMPYQNMLYFSADGHDGGGAELWRFNGSAVGRVTDLNPGAADSNPMYLTLFNNALYFIAKGSDNKGPELWKFDGNTNTATRVAEVNPDTVSNPAYLAEFNKALYFSGTSSQGGTELWKYDGTSATLVKDINSGVGNSNPSFLTVFKDALYFSAADDTAGTELWKFDGTNTTLVKDIKPGPNGSIPTYLTVFNNALYFSANGDDKGFELWKFDGADVTRVSDINLAGDANPAFLTVYNGELYFQANGNDGAGAELWKYKP